jgi:hypothetical protein
MTQSEKNGDLVRRAAEIIAGLERKGVAVSQEDDSLRLTAKGRPPGAVRLRSSAAPISSRPAFGPVDDEAARRIHGCSPKPSNRVRLPHFWELHALNAQQDVARDGRRDRG